MDHDLARLDYMDRVAIALDDLDESDDTGFSVQSLVIAKEGEAVIRLVWDGDAYREEVP